MLHTIVYILTGLGIAAAGAFILATVYGYYRGYRLGLGSNGILIEDHSPATGAKSINSAISGIAGADQGFSEILLLDFARILYRNFLSSMGKSCGRAKGLSSFFSSRVVQQLETMWNEQASPDSVEVLAIGASAIVEAVLKDSGPEVSITFPSTITLIYGQGKDARKKSLYRLDRITIGRAPGLISAGPEKMRALSCPLCGRSFQAAPDGSCSSCGKSFQPGEKTWALCDVENETAQPLSDFDAVAPVPRTDVESFTPVLDPGLAAKQDDFLKRNPDFSESSFKELVAIRFMELQNAWCSGQWEKAAGLMTPTLYESYDLVAQRYKRNSWRNAIEDLELCEIVISSYDNDAYYDAVTVWLKAKGRDAVLDGSGKAVCGDPDSTTKFSEYWTFIRLKGIINSDGKPCCPGCGETLDNEYSSKCKNCSKDLGYLETDWTLAFIGTEPPYETGELEAESKGR